MVTVAWFTCPSCKKRFYVETPQLHKGNRWFCPFCKRDIDDSDESLKIEKVME